MDLALIVLLLLTALACVLLGTIASQLHNSDPAGNGLAQVYFLFTMGLAWLLVSVDLAVVAIRPPAARLPALPWTDIGVVAAVLFVFAVIAQVVGITWLFKAKARSVRRWVVNTAMVLVPLSFVLFAAWRGVGFPVTTGIATWGCAGAAAAGSVVLFAVHAFTARKSANAKHLTVSDVAYPALLLNGGHSVRVLRYAEELKDVPAPIVASKDELMLVDANCGTYTVTWADSGNLQIERGASPMSVDALRTRLLGICSLHPNALRDAEIRRLIGMQRDVSALTFVLER